MIDADKFWGDYRKEDNRRLHLCDIPQEIFYARHKNVLKLIKDKKYPAEEVGLFIAGKYYDNVWASRSCSGYLAHLLNAGDYMTFYCSSACYFASKHSLNPVYTEFIKADTLDNHMDV
jgi:hypothetical protein